MRTFSLSFLVVILISGCDMNQAEVIEVKSPFTQFFGLWELESEVYNGVTTEIQPQSMFIEDKNPNDLLAEGYYDLEGEERFTMQVELTDNENEIILTRVFGALICTYKFVNNDTLELDDSDETTTTITTWKKS